MTEYFTKNTVEAKLWCKRCFKYTMHRIDKGRKGPCLDCCTRARPQNKVPDPQAEQLNFRF